MTCDYPRTKLEGVYLKLGFASRQRRQRRYRRNSALFLTLGAAFWLIVFSIYRGLL